MSDSDRMDGFYWVQAWHDKPEVAEWWNGMWYLVGRVEPMDDVGFPLLAVLTDTPLMAPDEWEERQ